MTMSPFRGRGDEFIEFVKFVAVECAYIVRSLYLTRRASEIVAQMGTFAPDESSQTPAGRGKIKIFTKNAALHLHAPFCVRKIGPIFCL